VLAPLVGWETGYALPAVVWSSGLLKRNAPVEEIAGVAVAVAKRKAERVEGGLACVETDGSERHG